MNRNNIHVVGPEKDLLILVEYLKKQGLKLVGSINELNCLCTYHNGSGINRPAKFATFNDTFKGYGMNDKKYFTLPNDWLSLREYLDIEDLFLPGDRVEVIENTSSHNYKIGEILTLKGNRYGDSEKEYHWNSFSDKSSWHIKEIDIKLIKTKTEMKKQFKNSFGVKGSKSLLFALETELVALGYKRTGTPYKDGNVMQVNQYNDEKNINIDKSGIYGFWNNATHMTDWEVLTLPQDWNRALELAKELVEVKPEYVKCTYTDDNRFTRGRIYPIVKWFDDRHFNLTSEAEGDAGSQYIMDGSVWTFTPSTIEAFKEQEKKECSFGGVKFTITGKGIAKCDYGNVNTEEINTLIKRFTDKISLCGYELESLNGNKYSTWFDRGIKFGCKTGTLGELKKLLQLLQDSEK